MFWSESDYYMVIILRCNLQGLRLMGSTGYDF